MSKFILQTSDFVAFADDDYHVYATQTDFEITNKILARDQFRERIPEHLVKFETLITDGIECISQLLVIAEAKPSDKGTTVRSVTVDNNTWLKVILTTCQEGKFQISEPVNW